MLCCSCLWVRMYMYVLCVCGYACTCMYCVSVGTYIYACTVCLYVSMYAHVLCVCGYVCACTVCLYCFVGCLEQHNTSCHQDTQDRVDVSQRIPGGGPDSQTSTSPQTDPALRSVHIRGAYLHHHGAYAKRVPSGVS